MVTAKGSASFASVVGRDVTGVEASVESLFEPLRNLVPADLHDFLRRILVLLPDNRRLELESVVGALRTSPDGLQRVLELVRRQWEGLRFVESLRLYLVGPPHVGKTSLLQALGEGRRERVEELFQVLELHGLDEYLGYGGTEGLLREAAEGDVTLVVLDAVTGFSRHTEELVAQLRGMGARVLVVLTKMDRVADSRRVLREARRVFGVPVVAVSAFRARSLHRLLEAVVAIHPPALYPLAQRLPGFRAAVCRGAVHQAAIAGGLVGAISSPVADYIPISAIQIAMVLKIARAHGFRIDRGRAKELVPLLGAGLLVREGCHRLKELVAVNRTVLDVAVGGVWTGLVGLAAIEYFGHLSMGPSL